jgi:hypothetical protein
MCFALNGLNLILGTYYRNCMADLLLPLLQEQYVIFNIIYSAFHDE